MGKGFFIKRLPGTGDAGLVKVFVSGAGGADIVFGVNEIVEDSICQRKHLDSVFFGDGDVLKIVGHGVDIGEFEDQSFLEGGVVIFFVIMERGDIGEEVFQGGTCCEVEDGTGGVVESFCHKVIFLVGGEDREMEGGLLDKRKMGTPIKMIG